MRVESGEKGKVEEGCDEERESSLISKGVTGSRTGGVRGGVLA